jgi:hypothetical protein
MIEMLSEMGSLSLAELHSRLQQQYWDLARGIDTPDVLRQEVLGPMWRQGLISGNDQRYGIGPQWALIRPYQQALQEALQRGLRIEELAQQEDWITQAEILFD